jgi:hypothetical protein
VPDSPLSIDWSVNRGNASVADAAAIGNNPDVESLFPIVVFGAVALSLVMSIVFLISRGSLYDQIGQGGLMHDGESESGSLATLIDTPVSRAERELEVRQLVSARSARMVGRGEPALDIEAEVARLLGPGSGAEHDPGLMEEVRQLVVARNERRRRQGLEPLDVEAETARTLAELEP